MKVKAHFITPQDVDIITVGIFEDNKFNTYNADKESIERFLITYNGKGYNYIVTSKGHLYASPDTPGYCDGETTVSTTGLMQSLNN